MYDNIITISFKGTRRECYAGQIIIKVHSAILKDSNAIHSTIENALGPKIPFKLLIPFDERGIGLIELNKEANLELAVIALEKQKEVVFAEPNDVARTSDQATVTPVDSLFPQQWGLFTIQAPAAWTITQGSNGIAIAIIDTGIPMAGNPPVLSHDDLSNSRRISLGTNYITPGNPPLDDHGHGTHVAGIASAEANNSKGIAGVDWNCQIFICKAFDSQGAGPTLALYKAVQESIAFARSKNLRLVINYSGGSPNYSNVAEETAKIIQEAGALLCASAGNDASAVGYPAAFSTHLDGTVRYSNVVAVSATTRGDELASFSNRGIQVNVAAPGVDILSTLPNYHVTLNNPPSNKQMNYDTLSGTSMAAPMVSGLAALIWSLTPNFTASQVRERLQQTAVDLPPPGRDPFFGFGRINAWQAVNPPQPPPPPPPLNPWENPIIRQWMDEWIKQADHCLKKKYPAAYVDRFGRGCGNFGSSYVSCNNTPSDLPAGWDNYRYLWSANFEPMYYVYRVREYAERRSKGESFQSLARCKV